MSTLQLDITEGPGCPGSRDGEEAAACFIRGDQRKTEGCGCLEKGREQAKRLGEDGKDFGLIGAVKEAWELNQQNP